MSDRDDLTDIWIDFDDDTYGCCAAGKVACPNPVRYKRLKRWRGNLYRLTSFTLCRKHWGKRNA